MEEVQKYVLDIYIRLQNELKKKYIPKDVDKEKLNYVNNKFDTISKEDFTKNPKELRQKMLTLSMLYYFLNPFDLKQEIEDINKEEQKKYNDLPKSQEKELVEGPLDLDKKIQDMKESELNKYNDLLKSKEGELVKDKEQFNIHMKFLDKEIKKQADDLKNLQAKVNKYNVEKEEEQEDIPEKIEFPQQPKPEPQYQLQLTEKQKENNKKLDKMIKESQKQHKPEGDIYLMDLDDLSQYGNEESKSSSKGNSQANPSPKALNQNFIINQQDEDDEEFNKKAAAKELEIKQQIIELVKRMTEMWNLLNKPKMVSIDFTENDTVKINGEVDDDFLKFIFLEGNKKFLTYVPDKNLYTVNWPENLPDLLNSYQNKLKEEEEDRLKKKKTQKKEEKLNSLLEEAEALNIDLSPLKVVLENAIVTKCNYLISAITKESQERSNNLIQEMFVGYLNDGDNKDPVLSKLKNTYGPVVVYEGNKDKDENSFQICRKNKNENNNNKISEKGPVKPSCNLNRTLHQLGYHVKKMPTKADLELQAKMDQKVFGYNEHNDFYPCDLGKNNPIWIILENHPDISCKLTKNNKVIEVSINWPPNKNPIAFYAAYLKRIKDKYPSFPLSPKDEEYYTRIQDGQIKQKGSNLRVIPQKEQAGNLYNNEQIYQEQNQSREEVIQVNSKSLSNDSMSIGASKESEPLSDLNKTEIQYNNCYQDVFRERRSSNEICQPKNPNNSFQEIELNKSNENNQLLVELLVEDI